MPMVVDFKNALKSTPLKVQKLKQLQEANHQAYSKIMGITGIYYGYKSKSRVACLKEYY